MTKKPNLRKSVDDKCRSCIYDPEAAGTWRQQVTLCSITKCPLYPVRPLTKSPIPHSVLKYYSVPEAEHPIYGCSRAPEGAFNGANCSDVSPNRGRDMNGPENALPGAVVNKKFAQIGGKTSDSESILARIEGLQ